MKPGRTRNEIPNKEIYCFEIFFTLNDLILIGSVNIVLIIIDILCNNICNKIEEDNNRNNNIFLL